MNIAPLEILFVDESPVSRGCIKVHTINNKMEKCTIYIEDNRKGWMWTLFHEIGHYLLTIPFGANLWVHEWYDLTTDLMLFDLKGYKYHRNYYMILREKIRIAEAS